MRTMPGAAAHARACALVIGAGLVAACLYLSGCGGLPQLDVEGCGNDVLNRNEDCDGKYTEGGFQCGAPASEHACFYVCSYEQPSVRQCPGGWQCSPDGRCRAPGGTFTPGRISFESLGREIILDDINGDEQPDLIGGDGIEVTVHLGDATEVFGETLSLLLPERSGPLDIGSFTSEVGSDIIVPATLGFYVVPGIGREPLNFPIGQLSDFLVERMISAQILAVEADAGSVENPDSNRETLLIFNIEPDEEDTTGEQKVSIGFVDSGGEPPPRTILPTPDGLAGPVVTADLDDNGINEILIAPHSPERATTTTLLLYTSTGQENSPNPKAEDLQLVAYAQEQIELTVGAVQEPGARFADVNGDQATDILVVTSEASDEKEVWAQRNLGDGTLEQEPIFFAALTDKLGDTQRFENPLLNNSLPWLTADLNGDALADYVLANGVFLANRNGAPEGALPNSLSEVASPIFGQYWTDAVIADINRDGWPDVIASISQGLHLMLNGGSLGAPGFFHSVSIETFGQPQLLRSGDFDGDLVPDVVYVIDDAEDRVEVLFGAVSGSFGEPVSMGTIADNIEEIAPVSGIPRPRDSLLLSDLLVLSKPTDGASKFTLMVGNRSRRLVAPYVDPRATDNQGIDLVAGALSGDFLPPSGSADIALINRVDSDGMQDVSSESIEIRLLAGTGNGDVSPPDTTPGTDGKLPLAPDVFDPQCSVWIAGTVSGDREQIIGVVSPSRCNLPSEADKAIAVVGISEQGGLQHMPIDITQPIGPIRRASLEDIDGEGNGLDLVIVFDASESEPENTGGVLIYWNDQSCCRSEDDPERVFCADSATFIPNILSSVESPGSVVDAAPLELNGSTDSKEFVVLSTMGLWAVDFAVDALQSRACRALESFPQSAELIASLNPFEAGGVRVGDLNGDELDDIVVSADDTMFFMHNLKEPLGATLNRLDAGAEGETQ